MSAEQVVGIAFTLGEFLGFCHQNEEGPHILLHTGTVTHFFVNQFLSWLSAGYFLCQCQYRLANSINRFVNPVKLQRLCSTKLSGTVPQVKLALSQQKQTAGCILLICNIQVSIYYPLHKRLWYNWTWNLFGLPSRLYVILLFLLLIHLWEC